MDGLIEGRNAHYVEKNGNHSPAIIEHVWNDEGVCNLYVMQNDGIRNHRSEYSVKHSKEFEAGTWHFIEKK